MSNAFLNALARQRRDDDRRRGGRVRVELTETNLGRVLDLSPTGVRLYRNWPNGLVTGARVRIQIRSVQLNEQLALHAEVVWVKKRGWFGREFGLRFDGATDEQRAMLTRVGRSAASNESVRHPTHRRAA